MSLPWKNESNFSILRRLKLILGIFIDTLDRYVLCMGNKIKYLRKKGVKIGKQVSIICDVKNFGSEPWLIEIGDRVTVTGGVVFINHDGASRVFRTSIPGSSRFGNKFGPIKIGHGSFIGINSVLLPNTIIGDNVIVGAGSVVSGNLPPNMVYAGVPAKPICTLDEYVDSYKKQMIPIHTESREALRKQLTSHFWGEIR
jgi:acetyltransferase-like isoleucine patch superfamily enzyme